MNILLLDQYSDLGGAQQALFELLPSIIERDWRVLVGLPGAGKLCGMVRDLRIDVEPIACAPHIAPYLAQLSRLATQIRALADRVDAELVYLNGPRLVPAAALAGLKCPAMFHSHSWLPVGMSRTVTGLALRRMNARVVANCEFVASQWRRFVPADRISVVFNGVVGPATASPLRANGPPRVGCIGRISPEKGQREFIEVAARIHKSLPECRFAIWGEALFGSPRAQRYAEEVRSAAAGLPVEFRGWVSDVYLALAELDLLLVPSTGQEATTRVILEAFAAGVPAIAFDSGGISEVVEHNVTGILTRSAEEMAREAVALLTAGPEQRVAMVRAARAEWQRRFTQEKFHHRLLAAMEEWAQRVCDGSLVKGKSVGKKRSYL